MKSLQPENQVAVSSTKFLVKSIVAVILCVGSVVCAQAQDVQPNDTNQSWTATTQTSVGNTNPVRTMESHATSGDRSVDKLSVEELGPNDRYQPDYETEKETVQVDATMTRTEERTYRWDVNGQRNLVSVTKEEAQRSAGGDAQLVRTTLSPDANGNFQVIRREVTDTRKINPNAQETNTTFYLLDVNGGLTPLLQTHELQERSADQTAVMKKTTLVPDSNGNWELGEVIESTIREDGKNRTSEESVSSSDSEGRLSEVLRTIDNETETAAEEKRNTSVTYSTELPGLAPDGTLYLNRRVTTAQKEDSGGKTAERQVEQTNPGDLNAGLQVSTKTTYVVQYGASGTQQTKTIQVRDVNGAWQVDSVETRKSEQVPAEQVQIALSDKPQ